MVRVPTEKRYEEHIEKYLTSLMDDGLQFKSRIHKSTDGWYDREKCLIGEEYIQFLKETQPETYDRIHKKNGENTDRNILKRLSKEIENKGLIHVLRKGFNDVHGGNIKTLFFQSNSSLNPERRKKYLQNKFFLVRQLHYSPNNNNCQFDPNGRLLASYRQRRSVFRLSFFATCNAVQNLFIYCHLKFLNICFLL